jgi:hypothetical protein
MVIMVLRLANGVNAREASSNDVCGSSQSDADRRETPMKVSIDVDCTPEEARRLVGLPDLTPLHAVYVGRVEELMKKGITPDIVESMIRNWVPMGESGMNMLSGLMSQFGSLTGGGASKTAKK